MNWTGGPRSRHYQNNARSTANLQRQHFAKVRTKPYPKAQPPSPFAEAQSGRGRDTSPYHHHRGRETRGVQADERRALDGDCVTLKASYFTSQRLHRPNSLAKAESGATTCDQGSARTRRIALPAAERGVANFAVGANATSRHRLSQTTGPRNTPPAVNKKRKLLKRDDWAGTAITRPLKTKPAEDWQMIGRRRKQAGGHRRHHILPANEQVGLSDVARRDVARGDGDNWTAGERGLVIQVGGVLASRGGHAGGDFAETMRGAFFGESSGHIKGVVTPELVEDLPNSGANSTLAAADSTAGRAAECQIHNDSTMMDTRGALHGNMCYTEGSADRTSSGTWLGFSAASHGSSVVYGDTSSKTGIRTNTHLLSGTDLDSLRLVDDNTIHIALGEPVCDGSCEGEGIWLNNTCKIRNTSPVTHVRTGSKGGAGNRTVTFFPANTQEELYPTGSSQRVEIEDSSVSGIRGNGGTGISTAPDELFWRSWLSTFIGSVSTSPETKGQPEISHTKNQDSSAKGRIGISLIDSDLITLRSATQIPPMKLDPLHHDTFPLQLSETSIDFPLGIRSRGRGHREPLSARCPPTLSMKHIEPVEAYANAHTWRKHDCDGEGNGISTGHTTSSSASTTAFATCSTLHSILPGSTTQWSQRQSSWLLEDGKQ
jgi:hypothetical protein